MEGTVRLKNGYSPRKQRSKWHKQGLICAGRSQKENQTSFSSFQTPRSVTSNSHMYKNPQTANLQYHPLALLVYIRPADFIVKSCVGLGTKSTHWQTAILQQLGWLPLKDRAIHLQLIVVHNIHNNRALEYVKDHFHEDGATHAHRTGASVADLCSQSFNSNRGICSFRFCHVRNWNHCMLWKQVTTAVLEKKFNCGLWETGKCKLISSLGSRQQQTNPCFYT